MVSRLRTSAFLRHETGGNPLSDGSLAKRRQFRAVLSFAAPPFGKGD